MQAQVRIIQVPAAVDSVATGCFIAGIAVFSATGSVQVLLGIGLAYGAYSLGLRFFLSECYALVVKDDPVTDDWLKSIGFQQNDEGDLTLGRLIIVDTAIPGRRVWYLTDKDGDGCSEQLLDDMIPKTKSQLVGLAKYLDLPIHAPNVKRRRYFL